MKPFLPTAVFSFAALALAACDAGDDKITVYRAPKETRAPAAAPEQGHAAVVHWTAPEGWEEQPASGFRKGSFSVRGADGQAADVSVISFPAEAGGLLANVNRWRNQLKLAPIASEAEAGKPLPVNGRELFLVDLANEGQRILGGILPVEGETWFFKMTGPDALVQAQRAAFEQFLGSIHVAEHDHSAHAPAGAGASTNAPASPSTAPTEEGAVQYILPSNWAVKPLTPMRLASFNATGPDGKTADVSVVSLGGAAGGELANVNRWRGQLNLPPVDEAALAPTIEHLEVNGHDFHLVDLVSTGPVGESPEKQRILAAILDEKDHAWFIKMTGDDATVLSQKSAFADFLRSLKIP